MKHSTDARCIPARVGILRLASCVTVIGACWAGFGAVPGSAEPIDDATRDEVFAVLVDGVQSVGTSDAVAQLTAPLGEVAGCILGRAAGNASPRDVAAVVASCSTPLATVDPTVGLSLLSALDLDRLASALSGSRSQYARPASGQVTSPFGDGRNHQGIDIAAAQGSPVRAVADGEVISAGPADGFGLWIRIRHDDGTVTTYGHNHTNRVQTGDRVTRGQQIGTVGNRGDSTGPHLHFEVDSPSGQKLDPEKWLRGR